MRCPAALLTLLLVLAGCAAPTPPRPALSIEPGRLPTADLALDIPGLGPCTDNPERSLHLRSGEPLNIMVHGCFGSSGEFRSLAQVLAFHGQQSACFTYDDRAALNDSASALRRALRQLDEQGKTPRITVIGHSQGALITRRALSDLPLKETLPVGVPKELVTVSGPFAGIKAAAPCGIGWLRVATLGFMPVSCHMVTGAKWADITYSSRFIREPGGLAPQVSRHLKIDTDERNTCRRFEGSRCVESDEIFELAEQRQVAVEQDPRVKRVELQAGHVEIIGDREVAPLKLITALQAEGVIHPTPAAQRPAFQQLLARVYGDARLVSARP
ncbi:esterase/lipase family protein [Uliginosibacterium aquaticum]|uniref:Alpha/beta hydrolase n=1 Tax=Uliginosibacterium aquaticum TaxID=2731212 RepID=A0ABX2ICR5_9RHOO|nr:alpha/beta hydrolase [Uliginosibacterium aquaticum]NSL53458.1 alpha/beta hydrolase [Uliginosibacterium aquaticum]